MSLFPVTVLGRAKALVKPQHDQKAADAAKRAFWTVFWGKEAWLLEEKISRGIIAACMAYVAEIERRAAE